MPYKDPAKQKAYYEEYYKKNKEYQKEQQKEYYEQNREKYEQTRKVSKEQKKEYDIKRYEDRKQNAIDSITSGEIIDIKNWNMWCNEIKRTAKRNKHSYSNDFTNDVMFDMMKQECFYCGDTATTIDRLDSKLGHILDNCVGCCLGCNKSKGAADLSTFVRKAYYRARDNYYDTDIDIWYVHKHKPPITDYKRRAKKKGVPFELTKDEWEKLVVGKCAYCHRSPTTWFGVDRIVPSRGYVSDNVESCCFDCNNDKSEDDVMTMIARNERIAKRIDAGKLLIIECEKVILHKG